MRPASLEKNKEPDLYNNDKQTLHQFMSERKRIASLDQDISKLEKSLQKTYGDPKHTHYDP